MRDGADETLVLRVTELLVEGDGLAERVPLPPVAVGAIDGDELGEPLELTHGEADAGPLADMLSAEDALPVWETLIVVDALAQPDDVPDVVTHPVAATVPEREKVPVVVEHGVPRAPLGDAVVERDMVGVTDDVVESEGVSVDVSDIVMRPVPLGDAVPDPLSRIDCELLPE